MKLKKKKFNEKLRWISPIFYFQMNLLLLFVYMRVFDVGFFRMKFFDMLFVLHYIIEYIYKLY